MLLQFQKRNYNNENNYDNTSSLNDVMNLGLDSETELQIHVTYEVD